MLHTTQKLHWYINPPSKTPPPLSCQAPLISANCPSSPLFKKSTPSIGFSWPPITFVKVESFSEPQKYESFSSLIPSYLLIVTKFLVKISQFEFLVMTEKNIFAYKLFLSLNISDCNLFFMWKLQPPLKKVAPLFPSNPPLKVEVLSSSPFLKIWLEVQPLCRKRGEVHNMLPIS